MKHIRFSQLEVFYFWNGQLIRKNSFNMSTTYNELKSFFYADFTFYNSIGYNAVTFHLYQGYVIWLQMYCHIL